MRAAGLRRSVRQRGRAAAPQQGGARGGGAAVTELGQEVLARYRRMQKKAAASIAADLVHLQGLMSAAHPEGEDDHA